MPEKLRTTRRRKSRDAQRSSWTRDLHLGRVAVAVCALIILSLPNALLAQQIPVEIRICTTYVTQSLSKAENALPETLKSIGGAVISALNDDPRIPWQFTTLERGETPDRWMVVTFTSRTNGAIEEFMLIFEAMKRDEDNKVSKVGGERASWIAPLLAAEDEDVTAPDINAVGLGSFTKSRFRTFLNKKKGNQSSGAKIFRRKHKTVFVMARGRVLQPGAIANVNTGAAMFLNLDDFRMWASSEYLVESQDPKVTYIGIAVPNEVPVIGGIQIMLTHEVPFPNARPVELRNGLRANPPHDANVKLNRFHDPDGYDAD